MLILKRALIGQNQEDSAAVPENRQWMWTLASGYPEDRAPTHGYEPKREAAMAAFAKIWRGMSF